MSKTHIVQRTDNLELISKKYYGVGNKISLIVNANPQLQGRAKTSSGNPVIHTGEILIIPIEIEDITNPIAEKNPPETIDTPDDSISILIDDNLFKFFTDYSMTFEIYTFDTFSFSAPFDDTIEIYRESFRPVA